MEEDGGSEDIDFLGASAFKVNVAGHASLAEKQMLRWWSSGRGQWLSKTIDMNF